MKENKGDLPVTMEAGPVNLQAVDWGEMQVAYARMGEGVDFTPLLKGLPDDLCPVPHWGYVLAGVLHVRYTDGHEEAIKADQMYYLPPGHTVWFEEHTEYVEFSPAEGMGDLFAHITKQMQGS